MKNSHPHTQLTLNIIVVGLLAILFVLFLDMNSRMKSQERQAEIMLTSLQAMGTAVTQLEETK
jgi:hypothetical protein